MIEDAIWQQGFCVIFIDCEYPGCHKLFDPCIDESSTLPSEDWADSMATRARAAGWISFGGNVLCPHHAARFESVPVQPPPRPWTGEGWSGAMFKPPGTDGSTNDGEDKA